MVNAEVAVEVVVAVVEEAPMEKDMGIRMAVTRLVMAVTIKVPENKRRCLNHTVLGNTR